jgi:hypothetical protein
MVMWLTEKDERPIEPRFRAGTFFMGGGFGLAPERGVVCVIRARISRAPSCRDCQ